MPLVTLNDLGGPDEEFYSKEAEKLYGMFRDYVSQDQGNVHARAPGIHASEISGCQRKMVYSIRGQDKKVEGEDFKMKMVFKMGHMAHDIIQKELGKMANATQGRVTFAKEYPIDPFSNDVARTWQIYSSCDGVFTFWDRDKHGMWVPVLRVCIEIKTMSPSEFEELTKPKPDHIEQAHLYMACLDIPITWFIYVNKSNLNMTLSGGRFMVKFNPKLWKSLEERFEAAHNHVQAGTLPDRDDGMWCDWCPYSHACNPPWLEKKFKKPDLIPLRTSK